MPAARIARSSDAVQKFPVGLFGLHRKMALVRGVIAASMAGRSRRHSSVSGTNTGWPWFRRVCDSKNWYVGVGMIASSPSPIRMRVMTSRTSVEPLPSTTESERTPENSASARRRSSPE